MHPLPTTNWIIGYKDIFGVDAPADRLSLVADISKDILIAELAGLNYRLKGRVAKEINTKFTTQAEELFYFCGKDQERYKKYSSLLDYATKGKKSFVFTRQACLYGIEEIRKSAIPVIMDFSMRTQGAWESMLLYILCVNNAVTHIEEGNKDEPINFESLSPKLLPISELLLISDPLYSVYRGLILMDYLAENNDTKEHLTDYFRQKKYNVTYDRFIFELYRMWIANKGHQEHLSFYYIVPESDPFKHLFDVLSEHFESPETFKLLNSRKNPFYKRDVKNNHYVLVDNSILLEKAYQQFINDFWFDKLSESKMANGKAFTMQDYKSIIGYFFEFYVNDILRFSFKNARNYVIKTFDELKFGKSIDEAGDIYIRQENKIILAEVKSTALYDKEKYSGNVDAMYKSNRSKFFKDFGIDQLVNNLTNIEHNFKTIDLCLQARKKLRIWPVIVVNERAFQTPLMAQIFNNRF